MFCEVICHKCCQIKDDKINFRVKKQVNDVYKRDYNKAIQVKEV